MRYESELETSLTLLGRVEKCDVESWKVFAKLYGPLVYSWCRNAGLQPADADDVGQDVFRVVSSKLATFEAGRKSSGAFRSWLWGITRLEILKYLRATKRQPVGQGGTDYNLSLHRLEEHSAEPESIHGITATQLILNSAFDLVKKEFEPRTWKSFWGMTVNGRAAKDVGDELGMTAKATRQAKFRVVKKMRELFGDDINVFLEQATK